jgi:hypothetical protein
LPICTEPWAPSIINLLFFPAILFRGITRPGLFPLALPLPLRTLAVHRYGWDSSPSLVDPANQPRQDGDAPSQTDAEARRALREAALAAAQAAEQEAADAAAERVRAALARAVKAQADAAVDPIEQPHAGGDMSVTHAMVLHEAAAVLNLHAQAVSVQNARSLVPTVLDTAGNYPRWREQFLLAVTKYSLLEHAHSDYVSALVDWTRMDVVVKSWLYSTVSADLADAVIDHRASAREAWLAIEDHFLGNQETRTLHLDAKFRVFAQGDLSITEYCKRFKKMVDDLVRIGTHAPNQGWGVVLIDLVTGPGPLQ